MLYPFTLRVSCYYFLALKGSILQSQETLIICITVIQRWPNVFQHCTNVIRMFCVCGVACLDHSENTPPPPSTRIRADLYENAIIMGGMTK